MLYAQLQSNTSSDVSTRLCAWRIDFVRGVDGTDAAPSRTTTVSPLFHGHELCGEELTSCRVVPTATGLPLPLFQASSMPVGQYLCGMTAAGALHIWECPPTPPPPATNGTHVTLNSDAYVPAPVTPPGGLNIGQYIDNRSEIRMLDVSTLGQVVVVVSAQANEDVASEHSGDGRGCDDVVLLFDFVLGSALPTPLRVLHVPMGRGVMGATPDAREEDGAVPARVRALAWGCASQQQHLVYMVVGKVLSVYTTKPIHPTEPSGAVAHVDCFDALVLLSSTVLDLPTTRNGHTAPPMRLTPTASGVVLVSHGQEVIVFSGWAHTSPESMARGDGPSTATVRLAGSAHDSNTLRCAGDGLRSIDELGYTTGNDLPHYHAAVLLDCLLSGKRARVTEILAHLTRCFRAEEDAEHSHAHAEDPDRTAMYTAPPLPLRRLMDVSGTR